MSDRSAGGAVAFKALAFAWAAFAASGLFFWLQSKAGVGGPAFAVLTRCVLAYSAWRVGKGIDEGTIGEPRPLAAIHVGAALLIAWLGIAASASPGSTVGFLSIKALYSRDPNAFLPELRQRRIAEPVALLGIVLIFVMALIATIRSRPRS